MKKMNIDPASIREIFISNTDYDHMGGLYDLLNQVPVAGVYVPATTGHVRNAAIVIYIKEHLYLFRNIFSTGELRMGYHYEHSLLIKTKKGITIIVGCSRVGVKPILDAAKFYGKPYALIGGLRNFDKFDLLKDLEIICPTHSTKYRSEIKALYPKKFVEGGVGKVIKI
ncbi:MAG: MBL fold metallo-hydrolase [Bacteroidetes bacterium]|nr:MAG: MBL fold metallo-hydrolase [Bacteroidota bacterium]